MQEGNLGDLPVLFCRLASNKCNCMYLTASKEGAARDPLHGSIAMGYSNRLLPNSSTQYDII